MAIRWLDIDVIEIKYYSGEFVAINTGSGIGKLLQSNQNG